MQILVALSVRGLKMYTRKSAEGDKDSIEEFIGEIRVQRDIAPEI
ncbi:hypothetical protein [Methanoculleus taiwanensis]|nr:hypothetical protein [Methanoculleus taiwanensis]